MYRILEKRSLNETTDYMRIDAPMIAKKAQPGQFIIFRIDETAERIPLTIADFSREEGWVAIIYQKVGKSTMRLGNLQAGDFLLDFVGPLGTASHLEGYSRVAVVGGGLGCAIAYPQAKKLHELGTAVDVIAGFRTQELVILEEEMAAVSDRLLIYTDDGSNGRKGLVTDGLRRLIEAGTAYDLVIAIGPPVMMKFVCRLTKEFNVPTVVSMNPIMIDGTGMCGCCRVTVGGQTKFACVDGPDFDGHAVDFDELIQRNQMYREQEQQAVRDYNCNLMKMGREAER